MTEHYYSVTKTVMILTGASKVAVRTGVLFGVVQCKPVAKIPSDFLT